MIPKKDLVPKPTSFAVVDSNGVEVPPDTMFAAARQEFLKLAEGEFGPGKARKKILIEVPGVFLREDATGAVHPVVRAIAEIEYEVTEEFIPFNLAKYTNTDTGSLITDAAVADVSFGAVSGQIMIVYKKHEGGHVVFVPNPKSDGSQETPRE